MCTATGRGRRAILGRVRVTTCDETAFGFGWIAAEPARLERASHALRADGRVWVVDPVDGPDVEARIRALGAPAGVLQLVDRHPRDCAPLAVRLGVPHHRLPFGGVPEAPFRAIRVLDLPGWREVALWWPGERVLLCTESLGTASYFRAPGEPLGVHPFLRLHRPRALRSLARELTPAHILVGHGPGIHGEAAAPALRRAVDEALRSAPRWLRSQVRLRAS